MRERKSLLAALAAAVTLFAAKTPASADGPRSYNKSSAPIESSWSGFYLGVYAGRAWGDADLRTDAGTLTATSYFRSSANIASVNENGSGSVSPDAAVGGAQIGFNIQHGKLVAGLEADFGAFNLNGSRGATNFPYPTFPAQYTVRASMDTDWLLTARARLGWAPQPNLLIYATGGLALTNIRISNSFSDDADTEGVGGGSRTQIRAGWTLGGGAEWALTSAWSVKAEYLYVDFGTASVSNSVVCGPAVAADCAAVLGGAVSSPFSTSADLAAHIARVGLNYKF